MDFCISLNCIFDFIKEYSFIISILLSGVPSFFIGWYLHKKKVDVDAVNEHFKDIKTHVLSPILNYLHDDRWKLPNIKQAAKIINSGASHAINEKVELDEILFNDFLDNHYPKIRTMWENTIKGRSPSNEKYAQIDKRIYEQLEEKLKECSSICLKDKQTPSLEADSINTKQFGKILVDLLTSNNYDEHKITISAPFNVLKFDGEAICSVSISLKEKLLQDLKKHL